MVGTFFLSRRRLEKYANNAILLAAEETDDLIKRIIRQPEKSFSSIRKIPIFHQETGPFG